jgi:hypothetical protein
VRLHSRNANDWTKRLRAIADRAERIEAKSFTIDGEAVVLGPDGLSRFEELSRREGARTTILYAFDLIEHDGEDMRNRPFLRSQGRAQAGILFNEHIAEYGTIVFAHLPAWCRRHRLQADRRHVSIRSLPGLDQGTQSRQHRRAAGEERDLEPRSLCANDAKGARGRLSSRKLWAAIVYSLVRCA